MGFKDSSFRRRLTPIDVSLGGGAEGCSRMREIVSCKEMTRVAMLFFYWANQRYIKDVDGVTHRSLIIFCIFKIKELNAELYLFQKVKH
jgi:hypothetical protein